MTGLSMLLKSFGIEVDPKEVEATFERTKNAIPELVAEFQKLNTRLEVIEKNQTELLSFLQLEIQNESIRRIRTSALGAD